jgi:hypothetical protein
MRFLKNQSHHLNLLNHNMEKDHLAGLPDFCLLRGLSTANEYGGDRRENAHAKSGATTYYQM